jgi:FkbM family methyltransferase
VINEIEDAIGALQQNQFTKAETIAWRLVTEHPTYAPAYTVLAIVADRDRLLDSAAHFFSIANTLDPSLQGARSNLDQALAHVKQRGSPTLLDMLTCILGDNPKLTPEMESIIESARSRHGSDKDCSALQALSDYFLEQSKSQLRQDVFVLSQLDFKENGFFVEFGASNGVRLSNTHLLEKRFGWKGILAEPARIWRQELLDSRSAEIETRCVWKDSNSVLVFNEAGQPELSTINMFSALDMHSEVRKQGSTYDVETISLIDLLRKFGAPMQIDYLSIDTEGSEFDILENFDFREFQFSVITCEHNFTPMREKIFSLLTSNGYERKYETFSQFDDWYVKL